MSRNAIDLLIRAVNIVHPTEDFAGPRDVRINKGIITEISPSITPAASDVVLDAEGLTLSPGFTDLHTHLREPGGEHSETIESGGRAAARGGFTRIFAMPNTSPVCDSPVTVKQVIDRAREGCGVRVYPVGSVTRAQGGEQLTDFGGLQRAGAAAFSDDGRPVPVAEIMRFALECTRDIGSVIFDHCEDMTLTGEGVMHEGAVARRLGLRAIPRTSESTLVARDCELSLATGGRLHICHVSNADSVEIIRFYKSRGAPVTAEVSPHHLTLTDERVGDYDTNAKMKPPLCEESDRLALIDAIETGVIDCIATDHAPHAPNLKADTFDHAPFGIIGMETAFPVLFSEFVARGRWSLSFLIDRLSLAPARVMNRERWARLAIGEPAHITLLDTTTEFVMTDARLGSRSCNCPWLGASFRGMPVLTISAGHVAYCDLEKFSALAERMT